MPYLFTSESVSNGHPDKVADLISDSLLDHFLSFDSDSRVACETMVTTGQVIVSGEVKSKTYLDIQNIVRKTVNDIGYNDGRLKFSGDSCGVISLIHEQSHDIDSGITKKNIEDLGAGDQGIMFGYACSETENYIPLSLDLSHRIMEFFEYERKSKKNITYLRPDAKSQVTVKYSDENKLVSVETIVISVQHDDFKNSKPLSIEEVRSDVKKLLINFLKNYSENSKKLFEKTKIIVNPAGNFCVGGPHGDTGLTGRKIIVDTYGGKGSHGGGAFSGKDSTKVDRSAAYMARYLAKNMVAAGFADEILIQLSYIIGVSEPVSIYINTFNGCKLKMSDSQISEVLINNFKLTPYSIQEKLKLRDPIYKETASYGHFGRKPKIVEKTFESPYNGVVKKKVELFPWEKLDLIDDLKKIFKINERKKKL